MNNREDKEIIDMLLAYCSECPELYNDVSNILFKLFKANVGAEVNLLCTYVVSKILKEM